MDVQLKAGNYQRASECAYMAAALVRRAADEFDRPSEDELKAVAKDWNATGDYKEMPTNTTVEAWCRRVGAGFASAEDQLMRQVVGLVTRGLREMNIVFLEGPRKDLPGHFLFARLWNPAQIFQCADRRKTEVRLEDFFPERTRSEVNLLGTDSVASDATAPTGSATPDDAAPSSTAAPGPRARPVDNNLVTAQGLKVACLPVKGILCALGQLLSLPVVRLVGSSQKVVDRLTCLPRSI